LEKLALPPRIFPEVVLPGTVIGNLLPGVQTDCGLSSRFPCVAVASHDTASAIAAIPELDESSVLLSSGTWSLMGIIADAPNLSDEFFLGGFTNEGSANGSVLLLKNMTGLWILQECVRIWEADGKRIAWDEVVEAASNAAAFRSFIDPAAPELQSPPDMCEAVQQYCAKTGQHVPDSAGEMARCIFESLSFAYRDVVESLERITGRDLNVIRAVGGGCLNRSLCQMTADACGREVVAGPVEAAALGNAMVQAVATGHLSSLSEGRAVLKQSVEYQSYSPAQGNKWQDAFERYKCIVARGRSLGHAENQV
jgi:rhamnulokinase